MSMPRYTSEGREVELVKELRTGVYLVKPITEDDETGLVAVGLEYVYHGHLFEESPPVFGRLSKAVADLVVRRDALAREVAELDRLRKEYTKDLKDLQLPVALKNIDRFVNKEVTHYVTCGTDSRSMEPSLAGGPIQILAIPSRQVMSASLSTSIPTRTDWSNLRLLSLFGAADGNLAWGINTYRDGSGGWTYCIPCLSLEEAKDEARKLYDRIIQKTNLETCYAKHVTDSVQGLVALGVDVRVPPVLTARMASDRKAALEAERGKLERSLAECNSKLENLA